MVPTPEFLMVFMLLLAASSIHIACGSSGQSKCPGQSQCPDLASEVDPSVRLLQSTAAKIRWTTKAQNPDGGLPELAQHMTHAEEVDRSKFKLSSDLSDNEVLAGYRERPDLASEVDPSVRLLQSTAAKITWTTKAQNPDGGLGELAQHMTHAEEVDRSKLKLSSDLSDNEVQTGYHIIIAPVVVIPNKTNQSTSDIKQDKQVMSSGRESGSDINKTNKTNNTITGESAYPALFNNITEKSVVDLPDSAKHVAVYQKGEHATNIISTSSLWQYMWMMSMSLIISTMLVLMIILVFWQNFQGCSEVKRASRVILIPYFITMLNYSVVILDSYTMGKAFDWAPGTDGMLVGVYMTGAGVGAAITFFSLKWAPRIILTYPRAFIAATLLTHLCGIVVFLCALILGGQLEMQSRQLQLMIAGRIIGGVAQGLLSQVVYASTKQMNHGMEAVHHFQLVLCTVAVAIGAGPLVASLLHTACETSVDYLWSASFDSTGFQVVPVFQIVATLGALIGFMGFFPASFSEVDEHIDTPDEDQAELMYDHDRKLMVYDHDRKLLVASSVVIFGLRSFTVSAIETSTALLLHRDADMRQNIVGIVIGTCRLAFIPAYMLNIWIVEKKLLTSATRFYVHSVVACLGCILLSAKACDHMLGWWTIVLADCLIVPSMYLCDSISFGAAVRNSFPEGHLLDANFVCFLGFMFGSGAGRCAGPWISRWVLESSVESGQDQYSLLQFGCCVASTYIFAFGVKNHVGK